MSSRRNIVTCGKCGTLYDASGTDPRCPACDERYDARESLPPLPRTSGRVRPLEGPMFESDPDAEPETAPLSEFLAAGLVLAVFIMMLVAVVIRSPSLLIASMAIMGISAVFYAIVKVRSLLRRRDNGVEEQADMLSWLFGRGYWGGRR